MTRRGGGGKDTHDNTRPPAGCTPPAGRARGTPYRGCFPPVFGQNQSTSLTVKPKKMNDSPRPPAPTTASRSTQAGSCTSGCRGRGGPVRYSISVYVLHLGNHLEPEETHLSYLRRNRHKVELARRQNVHRRDILRLGELCPRAASVYSSN
jgi:hypothetical protein